MPDYCNHDFPALRGDVSILAELNNDSSQGQMRSEGSVIEFVRIVVLAWIGRVSTSAVVLVEAMDG